MRIVGGKWRGRTVWTPKGQKTTRPTTEGNRERLASMVASARGLSLEGAHVLDAFAGSGALGFELLSRGCVHATLVDCDRAAVACMRRTAEDLGAGKDEITVVCADVVELAERGIAGAPFDIVLLDPPYALSSGTVSSLVLALSVSGQLTNGAIIVYEHARSTAPLELYGLVMRKSRHQGSTTVDLMVWEGVPTS